jgi:D-serine deaminase-like pyridoxal phosphate-dependent protein
VKVLYPELDTPALLFDLDVVEINAAEMAKVASDAGVRLRPHTKTHKSPEIAEIQRACGASGITVAKLGEAEVMVDAGFDDVLIAYPIWGEAKLARLRRLLERASIQISLDSTEVAEGIGRVGLALSRNVPIFVEVDTGLHRLGRPPGPPTVALVRALSEVPGIDVVGLLTHAGHAYSCQDEEALRATGEREGRDLVLTADMCSRAGVRIHELSAGSTPTAKVVARVDGVTEIRPGTYIFNDVQQMRLGVATEAECAARVLVTVVARPSAERFVIDAGTKTLTADGDDADLFPGRGVIVGRPDLRLDVLTEEHGIGHIEGVGDVRIGDRLEIVPLHACGCVNMFDVAYGVRSAHVAREITVAGRGKMR